MHRAAKTEPGAGGRRGRPQGTRPSLVLKTHRIETKAEAIDGGAPETQLGERLPKPFSAWPFHPRARLPSEYKASPQACQRSASRNHEQVADPTDRPHKYPGACRSAPACW